MLTQFALVVGFAVGYFVGIPWLVYVSGASLLVMDLVLMARRELSPIFPTLCYGLGVLFVRPWYVGVLAGSAVSQLVELPRFLTQIKSDMSKVKAAWHLYRVRNTIGATESNRTSGRPMWANLLMILGSVLVMIWLFYFGAPGIERVREAFGSILFVGSMFVGPLLVVDVLVRMRRLRQHGLRVWDRHNVLGLLIAAPFWCWLVSWVVLFTLGSR